MKLKLWAWPGGGADGHVAPLVHAAASIPDAVLCSEMGVSFSACGRYLAACVACTVPPPPPHPSPSCARPPPAGRSLSGIARQHKRESRISI